MNDKKPADSGTKKDDKNESVDYAEPPSPAKQREPKPVTMTDTHPPPKPKP